MATIVKSAEEFDLKIGHLIEVSEVYAFLACNEFLADVHFLVGNTNVKIPGHRIILAMSSWEFYNLFYGTEELPPYLQMVPQHEQQATQVYRVTGVMPNIFQLFLRYCYTRTVTLLWEDVCETFQLAVRFRMRHLHKLCVNFLRKSFTSENILQYLSNKIVIEHHYLINEGVCFIQEKAPSVLQNPLNHADFLHLPLEVMQRIIKLDELKIDEVDLFNQVMDWAKHHCLQRHLTATPVNLRRVMGDAIYDVRFPIMKHQAFLNILTDYPNILNGEEIAEINIIKTGGVEASKSLRFPCKERSSTSTTLFATGSEGWNIMESMRKCLDFVLCIKKKP
ncbi:BTB domain-containing protein [Sergentomyia squamirostris]